MLSKKNSCQTIVTSRKQIVQENIQQWWQTNAPTETGLTQNYGIIQKCIENGLPHSKGILRISKVYRQMANNCTTSVRRTKMSRFFGYCLSIVEEFFFLGFISAIVAMVFFHSSPMAFFSQMNNSASFSSAFFSYLSWIIHAHPKLHLQMVVHYQTSISLTSCKVFHRKKAHYSLGGQIIFERDFFEAVKVHGVTSIRVADWVFQYWRESRKTAFGMDSNCTV